MNIYFWIDSGIIAYFLLVNTFLAILLILSMLELRRRTIEKHAMEENPYFNSNHLPPITTIITTFNEQDTILDAAHTALSMDYPYAPLIIMINGSEDKTLQLLIDTYALIPAPPAVPQSLEVGEIKGYYRSQIHQHLLVIDKVRGAKGDAVTAALNATMTPYYVAIDGDTFLDKNTYRSMARVLLMQPNVVAIAGSLRVANGTLFEKGEAIDVRISKHYLVAMQTLEYLRAFMCGRSGWNRLGGAYLISGALGLFSKEAVLSVGGYDRNFAEDLDITMRLYARNGKDHFNGRIYHLHDALGWTSVPTNLRWLGRQRRRWQLVLMDAIAKYFYMIFDPKYAPQSFLHLPYLLFIEGLGPFVEGFGYCYILFSLFNHTFSLQFFILFLLLAWGYTALLSLISLVMEGHFWRKLGNMHDIVKICLLSFAEIFGYRQMTVWWRICGALRYLIKKRRSW